jgi:glutathione synthase/RimK-type ligase-like ATP-grasp enzyme
MKTIGVLFGMENSFPGALVEHINARNVEGIRAEFVQTGAVHLDKAPRYSVILDRISHDIPFYRAFLKHAAINGTVIINNPFWWSADDKFFNYTLAERLGVAVPATVILPHKQLPAETTERSMRNLEYPLDWDAVFAYVGEHGFLKPIDGGGWRDVYHVHNREEFFRAYDQSRDLCMMYQKAVDFVEYFRCYVVGQKKVHVMPYDPRRPHAERYIQDPPRYSKALLQRVEQDALKLCQALGYDLNTVEFAVENGIPYAIDFMNPAPDADLNSVGVANFEWIVREVADMVIAKAKTAPHIPELRWSVFLDGNVTKTKSARKKTASKKAVSGKAVKSVATATKKNSKIVEDEEAITAAAEPMGSVAAAVARDEGSSAAKLKKPEPPKVVARRAGVKPSRP